MAVMILRIGQQFSPSFLRSGYGPGEGVRTHADTNCQHLSGADPGFFKRGGGPD